MIDSREYGTVELENYCLYCCEPCEKTYCDKECKKAYESEN
jgi:hypothetical protein